MRSLLLLGFSILVRSAIIGEWNDLDRDNYEPVKGRPCAEDDEPNQPGGVKFYVDSFREKVYAFYFNGCDGNENVYEDVPMAEKNIPKDSAQCDGFNMTGWPTYAEEGNEKNYICQPGSYYLNYGEFSAICCDNSTAERYRVEVSRVCPNGDEPLTHQVVYKNTEDETEKEESRRLVGRNCTHRFCPETHTCHQREFEAFCCPLPPPTESTTTVKSPELETPAGLEGSEDGFSSLWIVVIGVVVLTSIVSAAVFWRRRSSSHKMTYDQREVAALNP